MPTYSCVLFNRDGTGGAVIHSTKPITACGVCVAKVSAYLCDYPTVAMGALGKTGTCDKPLCDDCRVPQEDGVDYCPMHARGEDEITHATHSAHVTNEKGQAYLL